MDKNSSDTLRHVEDFKAGRAVDNTSELMPGDRCLHAWKDGLWVVIGNDTSYAETLRRNGDEVAAANAETVGWVKCYRVDAPDVQIFSRRDELLPLVPRRSQPMPGTPSETPALDAVMDTTEAVATYRAFTASPPLQAAADETYTHLRGSDAARALRHAAHVYHTTKDEANKTQAEAALYLAALAFSDEVRR